MFYHRGRKPEYWGGGHWEEHANSTQKDLRLDSNQGPSCEAVVLTYCATGYFLFVLFMQLL